MGCDRIEEQLRDDERAITSVLGALLLVMMVMAIAGLVASSLFEKNLVKKGVELYFVNVEANTNGWINCTATGRDNVTISSLKMLVNNELFIANNTNMLIDGKPYAAGSNDRIYGGAQIAIRGSAGYSSGQDIRLTVSDTASGTLLCDVAVRVALK